MSRYMRSRESGISWTGRIVIAVLTILILGTIALGYYVKGAVGAVFISFLLLHFCVFLGFSFIPESSWNAPSKSATTAQSPSVLLSPSPPVANQGPPVIIFRISRQ